MNPAVLVPSYQPGMLAASLLMGVYAAYIAIDLVKRIAAAAEPAAGRWLSGGAFAVGTAFWTLQYTGMLGFQWPVEVGHSRAAALLSWVLSVAVSGGALWLGSQRRVGLWRQFAGSLGLGAALALVCGIGMSGLTAARIEYDSLGLLTLAVATIGAAGVVGPLFIRFRKQVTRVPVLHTVTALVAGVGLTLLHVAGMATLAVLDSPEHIPDDLMSIGSASVLVTLASAATLAFLLFSSTVDARARRASQRLAESLLQANTELQQLTACDALTGLPNRQMFEERLSGAVSRADGQNGRLAVLFVNLDGFKPINESLGHEHGDALLRATASRLLEFAGSAENASRAGNDEFLMLLPGNPTRAEVVETVRGLMALIARPHRVAGRDLEVGCSIGIAMYPDDGAMSRLVAHADATMNAAKRHGGSTFCFFEQRMVEHARDQVELLRDLRHAIANGQLELFYQPKIHVPSGQVTGAEALMRWHHPQRGMVSPAVFIPIAERFGLIGALGNWVIEDACRQIRAWRDKGLRMRVAINLSVQQLRQPDLVERIGTALSRYRVEPRQLTCEFTESAAMDDADATLRVIKRLSALGVHLSIDDFGTGYSSLSYLRRLPVDELKIDRSFVLDLETSADARAIVDAVMKMAQALGRKVVAEGVETQAQEEILRSFGCDELQGYLFAKPMSARALAIWAMTGPGPNDPGFRASLFARPTVIMEQPLAPSARADSEIAPR